MWIKGLITKRNSKSGHLFRVMCGIQTSMLDYKLPETSFLQGQNIKFHHQVLKFWFKIKGRPPETAQKTLNEYICYNKYITIDNSPIVPSFFGKRHEIKNLKIYNLLCDNNEIGNSHDLKEKLQLNTNFLKIDSLLNAIPADWKKKIKNFKYPIKEFPPMSIIINSIPKPFAKVESKSIYLEMSNLTTKPPTAISKWIDLFPFLEKLDWKPIFTLVFTITREPYLQSFQYKILNRSLNCNYNLVQWKVTHDAGCNYCTLVDTIEHHLYYCNTSMEFWENVSNWINEITKVKIRFAVCDIIFGLTNRLYDGDTVDFMTNYLILLGKWYLNKQKSNRKQIIFTEFVELIKDKLKCVRMSYMLNEKLNDFIKMFGLLYEQ